MSDFQFQIFKIDIINLIFTPDVIIPPCSFNDQITINMSVNSKYNAHSNIDENITASNLINITQLKIYRSRILLIIIINMIMLIQLS